VAEGRPHIVDRIKDGDVALIFNTTEGWQSLQGLAVDPCVGAGGRRSLFHHGGGQRAARRAIGALRSHALEVTPLQDYYCRTAPPPDIDGTAAQPPGEVSLAQRDY
jgi:carbamoyl-phosphate synthase large subunit